MFPVHAVTYRAHCSLFISPSVLNSEKISENTLLASGVRLLSLSVRGYSRIVGVGRLVMVSTSPRLILRSRTMRPLSLKGTGPLLVMRLNESQDDRIRCEMANLMSKMVTFSLSVNENFLNTYHPEVT